MASLEYKRGSKKQNAIENTIQQKTEITLFDSITGKKISTQKETNIHKTKQISKQEEWEQIKIKRMLALTEFKQMKPQIAKIKSKVFAIYLDYITDALIELENLRIKLKLSYTNTLWTSISIVELFVFGVTNNAYNNRPVPDSFQYLVCLWSWPELVAWCKHKILLQHVASDYILPTNDDYFLIRPSMVAYSCLGHQIAKHIPKLQIIMREKNFIQSKNFPILKELIIPKDDIQPYNTIVLKYSFTLYEPRLDLPELEAPFALKDGTCAISVDGPLTKLFDENLSDEIYEHFSLLALK